MGKKRIDKNCVEIAVCVDPDLEDEIVKYKGKIIYETGKANYRKSDAASDYFRLLFKERQNKLPDSV